MRRAAGGTGAASGIGRAIAAELGVRGWPLALVDRAPLADEAPGASRHVVDVADPTAWDRLVGEVDAAHGGVGLLVHAAGLTVHGPFEAHDIADVDRVVAVDLLGVMYGCRALLPRLRDGGGRIVIVSSMSALFGTPMQATYCAAKAGVRTFGHALDVELAGSGVGVTVALPGTVATPFLQHAAARHASAGWMGDAMRVVGADPARVARRIVR
ncbi:MAG TPA: SDR family oxidoreductase, partial [Myxococcota bacterium]|nr:SDR family oxidoreductase [Myxococcota bacterium]